MTIWGSPNAAASLSGGASLLLSKEVWHFPEGNGVSESEWWFLPSIERKSQLLEDLFRANFNLGNIFFRNGQKSNAVRCLEQAKECARKMKDKFSESECFHCISKVSHRPLNLWSGLRSLCFILLLHVPMCCASAGSVVSGGLRRSETFSEKGSIVGFSADCGQAVCEKSLQIW